MFKQTYRFFIHGFRVVLIHQKNTFIRKTSFGIFAKRFWFMRKI